MTGSFALMQLRFAVQPGVDVLTVAGAGFPSAAFQVCC